jgi:UDP-N-acetylglucosamine 2-epimerase (non-hydrolysing)
LLTILSVFGTRPEAIKMAPVVQQLNQYPAQIRSVICVTAQHRQMLDQVLNLFNIQPHYDLNLMRPNQSLSQITAAVIGELDSVLQEVKPDWVLVQGDTTTVMATALVAFYHRVKVGHVEAGLRTRHKYQPFPEEINRHVTDVLADLFFAPTESARQNLLKEGTPDAAIRVTGNTVIDALLQVAAMDYDWNNGPLAGIPTDKRLILITAHRRESFGEPFRNLCLAIRDLAQRYQYDCHFVYPVHLNPNVQAPVCEILGNQGNISLIEPLDYLPLIQLMKHCVVILTDSGGIQEEAPSLGVPVLVLRETTERPEAIEAGTAKLVGTDRAWIVSEASRLLDDAEAHAQMARAVNPYGDGQAAQRIATALING